MAKCKCPKGSDIPEWVVTYGDLMSLLLCFFILLVAFSEPKKPKEFQKVLEKIKEALGFRGGSGQTDTMESPGASAITILQEAIDRGDDGKFAEEAPRRNIVGTAPEATTVHEGDLRIIGGTLTFAAGSAALTEDVKHELRDEVAGQIRDRKNIIRVIGHSDGPEDQTMGGHWEASFQRAQAVRDFLVDECDVDPLILRIELAANMEPAPASKGGSNRRVQVVMTGHTVDQLSQDPFGTGR